MADRSAGRSAQALADARRAEAHRLLERADRYQRGADGEVMVAERLRELPPLFTVLHDLQVPDSKANIDHLVIGPSGVFVVDAKHYSQPLRVRNDMIWRGRFPIRKELDVVTWEAQQAEAALGVPVHPMLCFVGSELPAPVVDLPPVRVTTEVGLVPSIVSGTASYDINDISRLTLLAQRHLPPASLGADRTRSSPSPRQNQRRAPRRSRSTAGETANRPRRSRSRSKGVLGSAALLVLAIVMIANPALATTVIGGLVDRVTPTAAAPAAAPAAPSVNGDFSCPAAGAGWTLTFQWPGDGPDGGHRLSTSSDQVTWTPLATWTSAAQAAPTLSGIAEDTPVHVRLEASYEGGPVGTIGTFRSPATGC